jgi:hypothetical protein
MPVSGAIGNDENTLVLLHMDALDASTEFVDSSLGTLIWDDFQWIPGVRPVAASGNAQHDDVHSKFGGTSLLVTGAGACLEVSMLQLYMGTDDYTKDFWIWPTVNLEAAENQYIAGVWYLDGGTYGWYFRHYESAGTEYLQYYLFSPTDQFTLTHTWDPSAQWYHVAIIRGWGGSTNTLALCVDGVMVDSADVTDYTYPLSAVNEFQVGTYNDSTDSLYGWIDEFRIDKGIARWTENFIPPTSAYRSYHTDLAVMLLIDCDGNDEHTSFGDKSGRSAILFTAMGNAHIDTSQYKFYPSSMLFASSTSDYLTAPHSNEFNIGGDWTMEAFFRFNTLPPVGEEMCIVSRWNRNDDYWRMVVKELSGSYYFGWRAQNDGGSAPNYWGVIPDCAVDTWYHGAVVGGGYDEAPTGWGVLLDGVEIASGTGTSGLPGFSSDPLSVGRDDRPGSPKYFDGWIADLRISDTTRYTEGFTPPTMPFAVDANSVLLLRGEGEDGSTDFYVSGFTRLITAVTCEGDTTVTKFGSAALECEVVDRSGGVNNAGGYLSIPASEDFTFGLLPFCIDMWVNMRSLTAPGGFFDGSVIGQYEGSNHFWKMSVYPHDGGDSVDLSMEAIDSGGIVCQMHFNDWHLADDPVAIDTWYHLAIIRGWGGDPEKFVLCIDGIMVKEDTGPNPDSPWPFYDCILTIGAFLKAGQLAYHDGWIDEVRITKGDARWTENFSPPTRSYPYDMYTAYFSVNGVEGPSLIMGMDPAAITSINEVEPS